MINDPGIVTSPIAIASMIKATNRIQNPPYGFVFTGVG
jgi:hypothetical protein